MKFSHTKSKYFGWNKATMRGVGAWLAPGALLVGREDLILMGTRGSPVDSALREEATRVSGYTVFGMY